MASTCISATKFYREIVSIEQQLKMPKLTREEQLDLYPKLVGTIAHSDFMSDMTTYIEQLNVPEEERDYPSEIRVRIGDWYSRSADIRLWMSSFLAEKTLQNKISPDTYFIQRKTIESMTLEQFEDGSIEITIVNQNDKWSISRKYSLKQRFLFYRFLESITNSFDQIKENLSNDADKSYTFEESDHLSKLFKENKIMELTTAVQGRSYFILKYFVGVKDGRNKYYSHKDISGNVEALKSDFLDCHNKGFVKAFTPEAYVRPTVPPVNNSTYKRTQKRLPNGTLNIHIWNSIGVLEIREKGAKSSSCFPFCGLILPDGQLVMRANFDQKDLIVNALKN